MRIAPIVLTFAFIARILFAQASAVKPGSVEGVVTNSVTGEPVKKATVMLQGAVRPGESEPTMSTATTDAGGHFHFDNVESGLYSISANRDGFMTLRSRAASIDTIAVAEEQHVQDVTLKLTPLGVVSGHVLDENGEPI